MMNMVEFAITDITRGWLLAKLWSDEQQVSLSNSHLGGLEAPAALLNSLCGLLEGTKATEPNSLLCWHGENNSYIWKFVSCNDNLQICVHEGICSFGLPLEGKALEKVATDNLLFQCETSLVVFAFSVYSAFKQYSFGENRRKFENSLFRFPEKEFHTLKRCLRIYGYK